MTMEKLDYVAILADMKSKRLALDASIAALEAALASGTLGAAVDGSTIVPGAPGVASQGQPMDLPDGAFLGKSIPDAIKLYLTAMRKRKTVREIATALEDGGMVSTSGKFEAVVQACLTRLKGMGQVLKFADGWGLAEWYPAGFRASAEKVAKTEKKKAKRKTAARAKATKETKPTAPNEAAPPTKGGEQAMVVSYFADHAGEEFDSATVAEALKIRIQTVGLICSKLAHAGTLERTDEGKKFRMAKVHAMPKAV